jgi:hypothetical protein
MKLKVENSYIANRFAFNYILPFLFLFSVSQSEAQLFPKMKATNIPAANPQLGFFNSLLGAQLSAADLDLDNDNDIIAMNPLEIWWYRNFDGQGSMNAAQKINLGATTNNPLPTAFSQGDIDNDGDIDIIVAYETFVEELNQRRAVVGWCENTNGEGEFGEIQLVGVLERYVGYIEIVDYDRDGFKDIIYGTDDKLNQNLNTQGMIGWFQNMGENGFSKDSTILEQSFISSITISDVDNDLDPDIIYSLEDKGIYWIKNGGPTDLFGEIVIIDEAVLNPFPLKIADVIPNNMYKEVLAGSRGDGTVKVLSFINNGFEMLDLYNTSFNDISDIEVNDLDNDGDLDVLVSSKTGISWFEKIGEDFGREQLIVNPFWSSEALYGDVADLEVADLNGDQMNDIIEISSVNITWYENDEGDFGFQNGIYSNFGLINSSFKTADLDNDEDYDILTSVFIDGDSELWFENLDGKGKFSSGNEINYNSSTGFRGDVYVGDVDGDGYIDALSVTNNLNTNQAITSWYKNLDGLGDFSLQRVITNQSVIQYLEVVDMDGDGDNDILGTLLDQIVWYENVDGKGVFSNKQVIVELQANRATATDLDNDGDTDIVFTETFGQKLSWVENLGEGNFSAAKVIQENLYFSNYPNLYVLSKDVDADGDVDLIVVSPVDQALRPNSSYNEISLFENTAINGSGEVNFTFIGSLISDVSGIEEAVFTDLDLDGDYDIVASVFLTGGNRFEKALVWYEKTNDDSTYLEHKVLVEPSRLNIYNIIAEDIDLDGDKDISFISGLGILSWIENQLPTPTFPKLGRPIPNLQASIDNYFQYTVSELTFYDSLNLNLSATLSDGSPLPAWLEFSTSEGRLKGTPSSEDTESIELKVTATNTKGDNISSIFRLTVGQLVAPEITLEVTDATCFNDTDGKVVVNVAESNGTETYSLDNESYQESNQFLNLSAGTYTVYVKTESGTFEQAFSITEPEALVMEAENIVDVACSSDATGSITVVASGGTGSGYEYQLNNGEYQASATFSELTGGVYTVTVRDTSGCTTSLEATINFQNEAPPAPTVRRSDESDLVTELSLIAENVAAGATLQWYRNGEPISEATGEVLAITEAGNYTVVATLGSCSSEPSDPEAGRITSISGLIASKVMVYPVPSSDQITLEVPASLFTGLVELKLISSSGQLLKIENYGKGISGEIMLDVSMLSRGTYFLVLRSEGQVVRKKITKQ